MVPGEPRRARRALRRLLRLVRHRRRLRRRAHHLRRHRGVELDLRPGAPAVLLAPLLQPPARPQLREPRPCRRRCSTSCASGWTSASTASASTRSPTSSRRRAPTARTSRRRTSSSPGCAPWSTPSTPAASCSRRPTSRRPRSSTTSAPRRRRSARCASTSRSCRGSTTRCARRGRPPIIDVLADTPAIPTGTQWGTFLRNHDELTLEMVDARGAGRDVRLVRPGPPDARQRRHPSPARSPARQLTSRDRADPRADAVAAGLAVPLLRRRDRHGRQHLAHRPRRGAHADAVDARPQRRLLQRRPRQALPARHQQPRLPLQQHQRRGPDGPSASLLHWIRGMLQIRGRHPVFGLGDFTVVAADNEAILAFTRAMEADGRRARRGGALRQQPLEPRPRPRRSSCPTQLAGRELIDLFGGSGFPWVGERRTGHADARLARLLLAPAARRGRTTADGIVHKGATIVPTKTELVDRRGCRTSGGTTARDTSRELRARRAASASRTPTGEVGVETLLLADEAGRARVVYQVPLTYRAAPLDGARARAARHDGAQRARHALGLRRAARPGLRRPAAGDASSAPAPPTSAAGVRRQQRRRRPGTRRARAPVRASARRC